MENESKSICTWTEKKNGKGDIFIPSCLGKSSNGVNVFKYCKKHHLNLISIFRTCPFCGGVVRIVAIKK